MKEGLWSMNIESSMKPAGTTTRFTGSMCRSHAYDAQKAEEAKGKAVCKTPVIHENGATHEILMECTIGGTTMRTKETATVTGEDSAHTITQSTFDPPSGGITEMTVTSEMKYLGPCPAGVEPGDFVMDDGKIVKPPQVPPR
jgi:hypothetical protein